MTSAPLLALFEVDVATLEVTPSPELRSVLGHQPSASPRTLDEWVAHVVDLERARASLLAAFASQRSHVTSEVRVQPERGRAFSAQLSVRIEYDVEGAPSRINGAIRELEAAELASHWSSTARLFDLVPAPISVVRGVDLFIEYVNPACVGMWQREQASDLVGRPLLEAVPELEGQGEYVNLIRSVIVTGKPVFLHEAEVTSVGPSGPRTHYFDLAYSPVTAPDGGVDGAWVFAFDITAIVLARREVDAANRAKDEFLATMSHELRTPLNAMMGWTTLLQQDPTDPARLAHGLAIIKRNAEAQSRLVDDLLDVSRIISGKLHLTMRMTDVHAVIEAALEVVRPAADLRGVRLVTERSPEVTAIYADAHRIQQIVWNLASNAVRFTPRDGEVHITTSAQGDHVRIEVRDTGQGIPAEHLPHVFERFRQVDNSTTRAHGGLGLGLAIVRYLVDAHGGAVTATSEGPNRGATFTVDLPVVATPRIDRSSPRSSSRDGAAERRSPTSERASPAELRGARILVIDDDADSLDLLAVTLESQGAVVVPAQGAEGALAASGPFDLVVSDIGMPRMDGYEVLERLRAREPSARAVPAIALTAYARPQDVDRARAAGFVAHVAKPYDPSNLVRLVEGVLAADSRPGSR